LDVSPTGDIDLGSRTLAGTDPAMFFAGRCRPNAVVAGDGV
jgi:hypothetical protein